MQTCSIGTTQNSRCNNPAIIKIEVTDDKAYLPNSLTARIKHSSTKIDVNYCLGHYFEDSIIHNAIQDTLFITPNSLTTTILLDNIKNPTKEQSAQIKQIIVDKLNRGEILTDKEIARNRGKILTEEQITRYLTDRDSIPLKVIPNYT